MAKTVTPANSIWPNGLKVDDEGYVVFYHLGTNKIDVPTTESEWPVGDKLVSPFVYQNGKLVGFCDTKAMTVSDNTTISLPYTHIEADFSSIEEGKLTVNAPNATVKKFRWRVVDSGDDNVIVTIKYKGCKTVNDVKVIDPKYITNDIVDGVWSEGLGDLEHGNDMFENCSKLTSFTSDLSSLTIGQSMFSNCRNLTTFTSDLSSLTNGGSMFSSCENLTTFTSDLSSLTNGFTMFNSCENLTTFTSDLSSLTDGKVMFMNCSSLTSFSANLPSLTDGALMFNGCKLDAPSVKNIIDTINIYSGMFHIGMGCDDTTEDKDLFAQEVGYDDMTSLLAALQAKGWSVYAQYIGRPTSTYGLRRPTENTLPVFVKLEETEDYVDYISEDDSKKYRLNWFHETTGSTEGYTQFNSLEEAIEHFNIKPIERN